MLQLIRDFIFPKAYDLNARRRGAAGSARPSGPAASVPETGDDRGASSGEAAKRG